MIKHYSLLFLLMPLSLLGQFTRQDSLRGGLNPERLWWDVQHYDLNITITPQTRTFKGVNTMTYRVMDSVRQMQVDLQDPMMLTRVMQNDRALDFTREGAAYFITISENQTVGSQQNITLYFEGKPKNAINPPWDGGVTWQIDELNRPFIATANQGIGASIWWPNKDHPYDEPDQGVKIALLVPQNLTAVANGRLLQTKEQGAFTSYTWEVRNPINNYGVNINIGHYVHFNEIYNGLNGPLSMDYWVLDHHLDAARQQFKQAPLMMEAFEYWFGPYPFYEDGYKLVEVPYLGMEHQSSVTYGNGFNNGYRGVDLSGSGWGDRFDFIIIHESGHEWFANNITNTDVADMWIHESFTAYSENLYLDYYFGKEASQAYVLGTKKRILNDKPIIGPYHVNQEGSSDMYYKGANVLHTLRQLIDDDALWRQILMGLNKDFYHQTISSAQLEDYISNASGIDLEAFWHQYLRTNRIPVLVYKMVQDQLQFQYQDVVDHFDMPLKTRINGVPQWIFPTHEWQSLTLPEPVTSFVIEKDFLVDTKVQNTP
ncbi:MAG: M1 family metallopeptidase [Flavobacteriaceae bacterium]|jgi:aminopeptidase N|nr:M1 family metallopeptidase [Flavobacteriaceae bacterium]